MAVESFNAPSAPPTSGASEFPWTPVIIVGGILLVTQSGLFDGIGKLFGGAGNAVESIAEPVGDIIGSTGGFVDDVLGVASDIVTGVWHATKCIFTLGFYC